MSGNTFIANFLPGVTLVQLPEVLVSRQRSHRMLNLKIPPNLFFFALREKHTEPIQIEFGVEAYTIGLLLYAKFSPSKQTGMSTGALKAK